MLGRLGRWVGLGFAVLLPACGDDEACAAAADLEDGIAEVATERDQISAEGICELSKAEISKRLGAGPVWEGQDQASIDQRAEQYVENCKKFSAQQSECDD